MNCIEMSDHGHTCFHSEIPVKENEILRLLIPDIDGDLPSAVEVRYAEGDN